MVSGVTKGVVTSRRKTPRRPSGVIGVGGKITPLPTRKVVFSGGKRVETPFATTQIIQQKKRGIAQQKAQQEIRSMQIQDIGLSQQQQSLRRKIAGSQGFARQQAIKQQRIVQQKRIQSEQRIKKREDFVTRFRKSKAFRKIKEQASIPRLEGQRRGLREKISKEKKLKLFGVNSAISQPGVSVAQGAKNLLTIEQRFVETFQGLKSVPPIVKQIAKDPKSIVPLGSALVSGIKLDLLNTAKIAKTSPTEALVIIGSDIFIGAGIGKAFRITGKLSKSGLKKIGKVSDDAKVFKPIKKPTPKPKPKPKPTPKPPIRIPTTKPPIKKSPPPTVSFSFDRRVVDRIKQLNQNQLNRLRSGADSLVFDRKSKAIKVVKARPRSRKRKSGEITFEIDNRIINRIRQLNQNQLNRLRSGADVLKADKKGVRIVEKKPRFKTKKIKESPLTVDLSTEAIIKLRSQLNSLKSGADILVFNKKTKSFKIVEKKPRFKTKKIKKSPFTVDLSTEAIIKLRSQLNRIKGGADIIVFDRKTKAFKVVSKTPRFKPKKFIPFKPSPIALQRFKKRKGVGRFAQKRVLTIKDFQDKAPRGFQATKSKTGQVLLQKTKTKTKQQPIFFIEQNQLALQKFNKKQIQLQKQIQKQKQKPKLTQKQKTKLNQDQRQLKGLKQKSSQLLKQTNKLKFLQRFATTQILRTKQIQGQPQTQITRQGQPQPFPTPTRQIPKQKPRTSLRPKTLTKTKRVSKIKPRTIFKPKKTIRPILRVSKIKKRSSKKVSLKQGFVPFVKSGGKFIRASKKPLSKTDAQNRASFVADRSTSRQFKIKSIGKVKALGKLTSNENKYFKKTRPKYRGFKKRKGVKKPLVNRFIERRKFAIDSRGEVRGLKASKLIKSLNRGSAIRKPSTKKLTVAQINKVRLINLTKARKALNKIRSAKKRGR